MAYVLHNAFEHAPKKPHFLLLDLERQQESFDKVSALPMHKTISPRVAFNQNSHCQLAMSSSTIQSRSIMFNLT